MFLEVQNLSVRYKGSDRAAVKGVSLQLAAGDIGALVGPSGCGKTTLLRAVAGLEQLEAGSVRLGDEVADAPGVHVPPEMRRIGMVFQDYALFPHMSVGRNIAFGIPDLPTAQKAARIAQVLELVGMPGTQTRHPHELSGGQQQRIALARALAPKPRLLLLDEPFSSLDAELRERLASEVRGILKEAGATALFVTHDQLEAFAVGDFVGVMNSGELHQWDTPPTLFNSPATRFVAAFVGDGAFVRGESGDILVRPHQLLYSPGSPVKAQIVTRTFRGSEFMYSLRLASGETVLASMPTRHDHQPGDWIGIQMQLEGAPVFPREVI